jgi:hypothetical protein
MHGLINCALQGFVVSNYGAATWQDVRSRARLPEGGFEAMQRYDDQVTLICFAATVEVLQKNPAAVLEDIGIYLVTHPELEPLRRLLRFGGATFGEFLMSLEELPERARLAIPDLEMPTLDLTSDGMGRYVVSARWALPGIAPVIMGALRAMADDYGALVLMELSDRDGQEECLRLQVFDAAFSEGRSFSLGEVAG